MDEIEGLKEELKQTQLAYQMASQISQFKTGFLGRIAHELRSPLSSLIGLHQLILSDLCESPEEEREFIEDAYKSAQKLMKIIDEIVTVSKLEYGTILLETIPVNLNKVFTDLYEFTHLQAANRSLKLIISPCESNLYVIADSQRFLQVLIMLVDTAIRNMEAGMIKISMAVSETSDFAQISIDTNCPFSMWNQPSDLLQTIPDLTRESIKSFSQKLEMSPATKFLLSQSLLSAMGGDLSILNISPKTNQDSITRLQCSLPLASDKAVAQILEAQ